MTTLRAFWRKNFRRETVEDTTVAGPPPQSTSQIAGPALDIAPDDPLLAYLQTAGGVVELEKLNLSSSAVDELRRSGVTLIVPLVSQGDLIGMINIGSRLSEQDYSTEDRKLLGDLASQAAPALRVAQLVEQQKIEAAERERIEQELRVASLIQHTLLPKEVPAIPGWTVSAYYQPARQVGGDFYDFIQFEDGRIAFIVADVTDKGIPAALVMATTRSILHSAAERLVEPGAVLKRTNDALYPQIPPKMFVTCFYALLDPVSGYLRFANAGHDVPYCRTASGVVEFRARGMPLGLMPGMEYEEMEATLKPGEQVLLYSDGLVEAHNIDYEMFGFPRLQKLINEHAQGESLNDYLLAQLAEFTGADWEQEDDVTLVTLQCLADLETPQSSDTAGWWEITNFKIDSRQGNERLAMEQVAEVIETLLEDEQKLERLKTAVAEATMNAMEHGNKYDPARPVAIKVLANETAVRVRISDMGEGVKIDRHAEIPDIDAKLAGEQTPRGWGLFLIEKMVDEMAIEQDETQHTIVLTVHRDKTDGDQQR
jgi:serine phosphatase RsbU (regulator of sigma subunit)/anti-sigma regulatory factor (Ser/Thr protein kinase)